MSHDAIAEFWSFWNDNQAAIVDAIEARTLSEWVQPISDRVKAIDPGLDWEMGAGREASHYFCVSAKGDLPLRVIAERWKARGPGDDETFEFHASRPGGGYIPGAALDFGDRQFTQEEFQFQLELDETRERIHARVFHPSFDGADERLRLTATFISLDNVLGEDEVERWIGAVELAPKPLENGADLGTLVDAVADLRESSTGGKFTILQGELPDGQPVFVTANLALKRIDNLLMDMHVVMTFPLVEPTPEGLTTAQEADTLNELEDVLCKSLNHDAIYIGRETYGGKRVLHFHAAAEGAVLTRIDRFCRENADRAIDVESTIDPTWEILKRW